jgi:peptide/nickel transport system substrate-binding protein
MKKPCLSVLILMAIVILPMFASLNMRVLSTDVNVLVADRSREPRHLDPAWAYDIASVDLLMNVYEPLLMFNRTDTTTYIPRLATSWSFQAIDQMSPEGLQWVQRLTFTIRDDVYFQYYDGSIPGEGEVLTPQDVEYTFERLLITDAATGPSWMVWEPLTGGDYATGLNATLTDLGWPINLTTSWNTMCDEAIDHTIESDATHVWFNLINVTRSRSPIYVPYEALLQILPCFGGIMNQAWCVWHGDWPGMQVGDDWYLWHDPATSPLYALPKSDTSSPGPHLNAALGTGPYMLDYWNTGAGNAWSIIKNPNYWEGWTVPFSHEGWSGFTIDGHVDRYTSNYIPDWPARKLRFLFGLSDFCDVPRAYIGEVLGQPGVRCVSPLPQLACDACFFNFLVSDTSTHLGVVQTNSTFNEFGAPPNIMDDTDFRLAIAHMFNYTAFLRNAFLDEAVSPVTPIIPGLTYYDPRIGQIENPVLDQRKKYGVSTEAPGQLAYDLNLAVSYLQSAWGGQLWATGFTMDAAYNEGNAARQIAATLMADAFNWVNAHYGTSFHLKVTSIPWVTYRQEWRGRTLPYFILGWLADFPDASDFANPFMHSAGDFSKFQGYLGVTSFPNAEVDDHLNAGIATVDPVQRQGNYTWLQQYYVDNAPSFATAQATGRHWERDWVRGWYYNPMYFDSSSSLDNCVYDLWKESSESGGAGFHDVEIASVRFSPSFAYSGEDNVTISVDVWNGGSFPETFDVTAYADPNSSVVGDEITIGIQPLSLQGPGFTTLTFTWNTTGIAPGNYTIGAVASSVPEEADLSNNRLVGGEVEVFTSVPCYAVSVTCPSTLMINPSIFTYDPAYQARLINIGNVSIISTGFEGALRVVGSSNGTIRLCVNQPNVTVYNFFLPMYGVVQVPLWLMFQPETHWETYNGNFTLHLTVCGTYRKELRIVGISIVVCQNGAYIVKSETVIFTWNLSGGSLVYLEAEADLPPGWTYSVDPPEGTLFETPHIVTVNITAPPDAREGDMGSVTLRAYKNATGMLFWQFIYFASTDNKPPTIEAVEPPTLALNGDLLFSTTVKDASGISNVQFWYSVNDGPWNSEAMQWSSGDTFGSTQYASTVPHVPDNGVIRYYLVATDWLGNQTQSDIQTIVVKYDLAVTEVETSKAVVGKGYPAQIDVTAANQGTLPSSSVKVAIYANTTLIHVETLPFIANGTDTTLTFLWNTTDVPEGNYTIAAFVIPILDETNTANNIYVNGTVTVTISGDVTGEGMCDMQDISIMIDKFMATPSDPRWNDPQYPGAHCDVNNDNTIDMADISIAIDHFMQT